MMTAAQREALATLVDRIRPSWDRPGILRAIENAQHLGTPTDVSIALLKLTRNGDLRSPAILAQPGRHWTDTEVAQKKIPTKCEHGNPLSKCSECNNRIVDRETTLRGIAMVRKAAEAAEPYSPPRRSNVRDKDAEDRAVRLARIRDRMDSGVSGQ